LSTVVVRPLEHRNLLWQRKLRHAERNKPHEHPQITGAVARQILRGHSLCQQRHNAPLAITERLYRTLRWTKQGSLPWLLLGLLVCTPTVRAQIAGFDSQVRRTDYAVSVRELRIPVKARDAFEKGLERLAKNDAGGSRMQFLRATATFPDYYEAYYHIGVADLRLGREEEAAQAFQKAIDLSGGHYAWAQFALGLLLCRRGEYAEAESVIRKGLDVDGRSATGHLFLSVALFRLNRLEEAEKSAREALLRKPGFGLAYLVLADVHARRGEYRMQLHGLDAYLKLEPDGPASQRAREVREVVRRIVLRTKDEE
jgi:tetratricopeptide (TPR) repeat protein